MLDARVHCVQRLAPAPGDSILDVATGTGWTARLLAARGAAVTGLDYSEELIAAARELARPTALRIAFDVGDAQRLPYPDGSFDAVISTFGVIWPFWSCPGATVGCRSTSPRSPNIAR